MLIGGAGCSVKSLAPLPARTRMPRVWLPASPPCASHSGRRALEHSHTFIAHCPIHGAADIQLDKARKLAAELAAAQDERRDEAAVSRLQGCRLRRARRARAHSWAGSGRSHSPKSPRTLPQACLECDVAREEDIERLVGAAVARWGRLDVMLNNAGGRSARPCAMLCHAMCGVGCRTGCRAGFGVGSACSTRGAGSGGAGAGAAWGTLQRLAAGGRGRRPRRAPASRCPLPMPAGRRPPLGTQGTLEARRRCRGRARCWRACTRASSTGRCRCAVHRNEPTRLALNRRKIVAAVGGPARGPARQAGAGALCNVPDCLAPIGRSSMQLEGLHAGQCDEQVRASRPAPRPGWRRRAPPPGAEPRCRTRVPSHSLLARSPAGERAVAGLAPKCHCSEIRPCRLPADQPAGRGAGHQARRARHEAQPRRPRRLLHRQHHQARASPSAARRAQAGPGRH